MNLINHLGSRGLVNQGVTYNIPHMLSTVMDWVKPNEPGTPVEDEELAYDSHASPGPCDPEGTMVGLKNDGRLVVGNVLDSDIGSTPQNDEPKGEGPLDLSQARGVLPTPAVQTSVIVKKQKSNYTPSSSTLTQPELALVTTRPENTMANRPSVARNLFPGVIDVSRPPPPIPTGSRPLPLILKASRLSPQLLTMSCPPPTIPSSLSVTRGSESAPPLRVKR